MSPYVHHPTLDHRHLDNLFHLSISHFAMVDLAAGPFSFQAALGSDIQLEADPLEG